MESKTLSRVPVKSWKLVFLALTLFPIISFAQNKKSAPSKGYGEASYSVASSEQYMTKWLLAGPVEVGVPGENPTQQKQFDFFKQDVQPIAVASNKPIAALPINGKQFSWELVKSPSEIIDLDKQYKGGDFAAAFALAEIKSPRELKTFLSVGSDDGIRVWHNGKLIHDNWIPRGVSKDQDLVPITLQPGSNQILLKVQDMQGAWAFVARILNNDAISDHLVNVSGRGDLENMQKLLDAGASPDSRNASGVTALNNARLNGREEAVALLVKKGAVEQPFPPLETLVDGLYGTLKSKKASGAAVLIAKDGKVIYKNGFGYADIEGNQLITPDTKFRIGSVTKQFTAVAILKLQEEGKISVDDKLSKFLPDFPRASEVTIHHLLTHTSGIHSYTGKPEFISRVTSPISEEELIAFFKNDPFDFNPGDAWLYNNSGYFLLGHIIGKITGKPYADYLKQTFFDPLSMTNTGVHTTTAKLAKEALGYTLEDGKYALATNWDMTWAGGAGALYSTVEDLYTWNEALFNGKVLQEKSLKQAFTPVILNNGKKPDATYGYGWQLGAYRGKETVEHSGGLHGFLSHLIRYPKENVTVAILTNITPQEVNIDGNKVAELLLWDTMEKQKALTVDASVTEDVRQYAGRYDFQTMVMTITAENNSLYAQLSGQPKFQIFPSGKGEYFWKVVDAKIKFIKNEKGEVVSGDFEQNGQKLNVKKIQEVPAVSIDKAFYKLYSGRYDLGNNFIITISTENDRIYAQGTNQPKFEIVPISENEFSAKDVNARLIFIKEADGKISKFILDQGGQKKDVVRLVD
jgi:CubicO group peptidase (beta-lactamase class C family)